MLTLVSTILLLAAATTNAAPVEQAQYAFVTKHHQHIPEHHVAQEVHHHHVPEHHVVQEVHHHAVPEHHVVQEVHHIQPHEVAHYPIHVIEEPLHHAAEYIEESPKYHHAAPPATSYSENNDYSTLYGGKHGAGLYANYQDHQEGGGYAKSYNDYYAYPKYSFEYGVDDPHTGDHKKQWEFRDGDVVKGGYMLKEADGTTRVVEYTSDDHNGFNAVVKNIGHAHHPEPQPKSYGNYIGNYAGAYATGDYYSKGAATSYAKVWKQH